MPVKKKSETLKNSPTVVTSTESEDIDTCKEDDPEITKITLQEGKTLQKQIKFVVFEEAILEVLG